MEKLIIAGRTNGESSFYIKFKVQEKSMSIIKKIVQDLGSEYFVDNQVLPRSMKFEKWKDQWIPIHEKGIDIDIICGDKMIHMLVDNCPNFDIINNILDKYCEWAQPKYKKGFGPRPDFI
jgi:hypothetical protein